MNKLMFLSAAAIAAAACTDLPDLDDHEDGLRATYKATVKNRTLAIVGNNASSRLALRLGASPNDLEVDVGDDGSADFTFDRSTFERITIDAAGGDDVVTMDERFGAFTLDEQVTVDGGAGNDILTGGIGAETLSGGAGDDIITGRGGIDTILLGAGDDLVMWAPGDASDVIEGGNGFDALVMAMANASEDVDLRAIGDRLQLTRNVAGVVMDIHDLERVELHTLGGTDRVFVHDLAAAHVAEVDVDLLGSGGGDLATDEVRLDTTPTADTIIVARVDGAVRATGLATEVRIVNGEPAIDRLYIDSDASDRVVIDGTDGPDVMTATGDATSRLFDGGGFDVLVAPGLATPVTLEGLEGDDTITAVATSSTASLVLDGGDGDDRLFGGPGNDLLLGGPGNDYVDGGRGTDTADLGDGDDTFVWTPGGASDVVDGGAGTDTLQFLGAAANESMDIRASGSRVRLARDVAGVTMDLGGIEHIDLHPNGGSDAITIGTLAGTGLASIDTDLSSSQGAVTGDGAADAIAFDGAPDITVTGNATAVEATGFGATLRVLHGDPALDRIVVQGGTLAVEGTPADDTMIVTTDPSGTVCDGGGYNILVAASSTTTITVAGNAGNDQITAGSATVPLVLDGGDGNDTINGGTGPDRLLGGPGNDVIGGGRGADTVLLGDGDDTFVWQPGDGSDVIDGEAGNDSLAFFGANVSEAIGIAASSTRVRLTRDVASVVLDAGDLEGIELHVRGGADTITVGDLAGTPVHQLAIDLGDAVGAPDGQIDTVTLNGTAADDQIGIATNAGAVVVSGLAAAVQIGGAELADLLVVHGGAGTDTFTVAPGVANAITLTTFAD